MGVGGASKCAVDVPARAADAGAPFRWVVGYTEYVKTGGARMLAKGFAVQLAKPLANFLLCYGGRAGFTRGSNANAYHVAHPADTRWLVLEHEQTMSCGVVLYHLDNVCWNNRAEVYSVHRTSHDWQRNQCVWSLHFGHHQFVGTYIGRINQISLVF